MAHLTPATPLGLYGPFHCLTPNPSPSMTPNPSPPPSRSSRSPTLDSTSSFRSSSSFSANSIHSINRILSLRRQYRSRSRSRGATVLGDSALGSRRLEASLSEGDEEVGLMEPRPREEVGWGIGEVLWGGKD